MKVLVTGAKGQLGTDLMNELEKRGIEGIGVDVQEMDITDAEACRRVIKHSGADAVIHCAAYTAVDAAEDNADLCRRNRRIIRYDAEHGIHPRRHLCRAGGRF